MDNGISLPDNCATVPGRELGMLYCNSREEVVVCETIDKDQ